jgi:hypothetical protein
MKRITSGFFNGSTVKEVCMKYLILSLILCSAFFSSIAAEIPQNLLDIAEEYSGDIRLWGVNDSDFEDENENEFFVLKFYSYQDFSKSIPFKPKMRITVQLTDRKTKTVVFSQITETAPKVKESQLDRYGRHLWECRIPYGSMKRPKLSAYAVEMGFEKKDCFVPVSADYDKVDSAEEIINGEGSKVEMTFKVKRQS